MLSPGPGNPSDAADPRMRAMRTATAELARRGVESSRSPDSGEVHALRGPGYAGAQFHPESLLPLDGAAIIGRLLAAVLD